MKKIKYLLLMLLLVFSLGLFTACNNENNTENVDSGEITKEVLEELKFENATFEYDGEEHSIYVENIPEGVSVTYRNNGKKNPGEYTVTAVITYEDLFVKKTAKIIINYKESVLTADSEQVLFLYGNPTLMPSYSLNNKEQQVKTVIYKDGVEIDLAEMINPGTYEVEIIALASSKYKESRVKVKVVVTNSILGLSFASQDVVYDGNEHVIRLDGEDKLDPSYSVEYSNNVGTEPGTYYALANVKDSDGNVVETHAAVLNIYNEDNPEFKEFLDMFFVEYLEGDQLSVNIFCENPSDFGLEHYDAEWYTYESSTEEEMAEYVEYITELYTELQSFADAKLSKLQEVAYRKVESFLVENIESYKIEDIEYLNLRYIDSFGGYVADFLTYMEAYSLRSEAEVQDIVKYIQSTKTAFPSYLTYAKDRADHGYALADYSIKEMRGYLKDLLEEDAKEGNYYLTDVINGKIDGLTFLNDEQKEEYKATVKSEMENSFIYGVQALYDGLEQFEGLLPEEEEGYWAKYESGKELYKINLQSLLGLNNFSFEQYIKELEATLNATSKEYMDLFYAIANDNGFMTSAQIDAHVSKYPIFDGTPDEMMVFLKDFAPTIVPELKSNPEINIKYMDTASAKVSNAVAYYMKSALDNTAGENITLNGEKLGNKNDVIGTLAHEGYPGHLYAYVYSKEIGQHNLSTIMTSTAHAEGWATYVELKLYDYAMSLSNDKKYIQVMEYLKAEHAQGFLLETRIDVGIHYEGWTVKEVAEFLDGLGFNGGAAQGIYDQFIEMPTTYAAYGYGKLYFVKLHNEAQKVLGVYYDEIEFNAMLLSRGWTSLGELENTYLEYMRAKCHKLGIQFNR